MASVPGGVCRLISTHALRKERDCKNPQILREICAILHINYVKVACNEKYFFPFVGKYSLEGENGSANLPGNL